MTTHTPTPWTSVPNGNGSYRIRPAQYAKHDSWTIADLRYQANDEANAAFIATACNAHAAMKAELENSQKLLLEFVGYLSSDHTKLLADQVKRNQTALALADGKERTP